MSALTIRMADDKYQRLKELAKSRKTSVNRLIDDMATALLAEYDAQTRFQLRAERGSRLGKERAMEVLDKASLNDS